MLETWMFLPAQAVAQVATDLPVRLLHLDGDVILTFAEALARLSGPWCLVLPAEAVTSCGVTLPTQRQRWLRKALPFAVGERSEEHTSELQSRENLVCRLLLEKK